MELYNSLNRRIEPFFPTGDFVSVYTCGITPYDTTHLGHAFTYTTADILIRYFEYLGWRVRYVQNVTDIDDDILRKAREADEDWQALGDRWTTHFIRDMVSLNVRPPDVFPRATEVIPEIVTGVGELLEVGVAYVSGGSVYFSIDDWPEYGKLCSLTREEMLPLASERGNNPDDPNKRNPLDFVLWQAKAPGEPSWDSPWGDGRPGWHIECSTMATQYLGKTIDIHIGGGDLIFPHHESEIAQVEPVSGAKPFSRFWMHVAMVQHQGEKMSKSLGNLVMVRSLLNRWTPDTLRLYLASHHYRVEWSFDEKHLSEMAGLTGIFLEALSVQGGTGQELDPSDSESAYKLSMGRDLDVPDAVDVVTDLARRTIACANEGGSVTAAQRSLRSMLRVFGLVLDTRRPENRVVEGWQVHAARFDPAWEIDEES